MPSEPGQGGGQPGEQEGESGGPNGLKPVEGTAQTAQTLFSRQTTREMGNLCPKQVPHSGREQAHFSEKEGRTRWPWAFLSCDCCS